ncbi:F-box domain containing protein [Pandoravirus celtis]|uniref:F-box domain containing protein n=1 Tax=Pandoravirus celtis TaxID=2568002 RepID=A0A4D6EJ45_9VIRU|nr:F-box domain containing protein [Pandoravirus celtis]
MHLSDSRAPPAKRLCPCSLPAIAPPRPHIDALLHIDDLPDEILGAVFCHLSCLDTTASVPLVCRRWRRVNDDPLVVPLRTCDPCADDSTARKRVTACVPTCPLSPVRAVFRLAMGRRMPDDFGRRERPSDAVFCLYARKRDRFAERAAFADRCRPLDSRPCELSAQDNGSLNVLDLANARWPCSARVFAWCVAHGTVPSRLVALITAGCPIDDPVVGMACAWHGRTDVLSLLVGLGATHTVDARAWQVAAMRGHIEWMTAARTRGFRDQRKRAHGPQHGPAILTLSHGYSTSAIFATRLSSPAPSRRAPASPHSMRWSTLAGRWRQRPSPKRRAVVPSIGSPVYGRYSIKGIRPPAKLGQ